MVSELCLQTRLACAATARWLEPTLAVTSPSAARACRARTATTARLASAALAATSDSPTPCTHILDPPTTMTPPRSEIAPTAVTTPRGAPGPISTRATRVRRGRNCTSTWDTKGNVERSAIQSSNTSATREPVHAHRDSSYSARDQVAWLLVPAGVPH